MSLDTFDNLKAEIADWLDRDDLTARIPTFIALCESRTNKRLRVRDMVTTATIPISGSVFPLPADFLEVRSVVSNVSPVSTLSPISPDASAYYTTAGYPYYFVIENGNLRVFPPNTANITLSYWAKIPALSASNTTNWLLTKAPEVYLWGTLLMSAPFLEDDNRILTWGNLYEAAITELEKLNQRAVHGKTVSRVRGTTP